MVLVTIGQGKRRDMGWSSIHAEDLLIAAAVLAALGDRRQHASLQQAADRLDRCARVCWEKQHPDGDQEADKCG